MLEPGASRNDLPCSLTLVCAEDGSFLERFFNATRDMSPAQRGAYLENPPPDAPDIDNAQAVNPTAHERLPTNSISCLPIFLMLTPTPVQQGSFALCCPCALFSSLATIMCLSNRSVAWQAAAQEGVTAPPALEDVVNLHFVTLVEHGGRSAALLRSP